MNITLYNVSDDPRVLNKTLGTGSSVTGELVLPTDMQNPTFRLSTNAAGSYNYCYVPDFGRYYFINNRAFDNGGAIIIHCRVDVLQSFKNDISGLTCNVIRQEQTGITNIIDNQITFTPKKTLETILCDKTAFNIRSTGSAYNYVICVAGGEQGE